MGTALASMAVGLACAWLMTILDWGHLSRRRTRFGWPQTDLQWQLPILLLATAVFAFLAWRFFVP